MWYEIKYLILKDTVKYMLQRLIYGEDNLNFCCTGPTDLNFR